jgi:CelD/BcsL family acetyltransferase involved in cellulose biosynthesis
VLQPPSVFQTPAYLAAYRRFFGQGKRFHRLHADDGTSLGAAWLTSRGHAARRLEWWGAGIHDIGGAAFTDQRGAELIWQKIAALAAAHDGAYLAQIEASSPLVALATQAGWAITPAETCPVLTLPATYPEYVSSLGKNMREQIKRYPKRLEKNFQVEYELAQTPEQVERALTDLFLLHGKRWRARGQTGVLALPRRQKFHRAVCEKFRQHDWLRLWSLRCDGAPACVLLSYFYGGRYYFFIGGFEPELMRWSVGVCLFARVFQSAIEEGAQEFDFLKGEEEYKYRYGAVNRDYVHLSHFADSPRGRLLQRRVDTEAALLHRFHQMFSAAHREPKSSS